VPINKIPYDITFHPKWWHKYASVSFKEDFFTNYKYRIEQDIKMRQTLFKFFGDLGFGNKNPKPRPIIDTDLVAGEYLQALLFGCNIKYYDDSFPEVLSKEISDKGIEQLVVPNLEENEHWLNIEDQIKILLEKYGYVESHLDLFGVQNLALNLRGQQLFIDYYNNPNLVNKLLSTVTDLLIRVGSRIGQVSTTLSCGVTGIMKQIDPRIYVTSNCTVEMVSQEIYEKYLLEYDKKLSKAFNKFGIHHCGKSTEHVVSGYKKVPNISFLEVGAFSDIKEVRQVFPETHLNLRYSPVKLKEISKRELKRDLMKMIKDAKPINKISISCVGIDDATQLNQIRNFLICIREIYDLL